MACTSYFSVLFWCNTCSLTAPRYELSILISVSAASCFMSASCLVKKRSNVNVQRHSCANVLAQNVIVYFISYGLEIVICHIELILLLWKICIYLSHSIAYGTGHKICLHLAVCAAVCCGHSHGRVYWSIFTKTGTDIRTPKRKISELRVNIAPPLPPFCPQTPIIGPEILIIHANIK